VPSENLSFFAQTVDARRSQLLDRLVVEDLFINHIEPSGRRCDKIGFNGKKRRIVYDAFWHVVTCRWDSVLHLFSDLTQDDN
jgi:hypothetical protein